MCYNYIKTEVNENNSLNFEVVRFRFGYIIYCKIEAINYIL